jgi:hypothetical protein
MESLGGQIAGMVSRQDLKAADGDGEGNGNAGVDLHCLSK